MKKHTRPLFVLLVILIAACAFPKVLSEGAQPGVFTDPDVYLAYRMSLSPDAPYTAFAYAHDPADNQAAMADVIVNPDAVFGFSPSPESTRLKHYADALDWTDPQEVAKARQTRRAYHESMQELYVMIADMLGQAKPVEEIARAVSHRRNEIRLESYKGDPEELARVEQSNLETYGDRFGPSADSLFEKYGSWQTVLEKALGTNAGMDACLGFYDEFYDLYEFVE